MYQYCTIQEAYNVPTFSRKKKNCMPLEPNASAEPYDPYVEQRGKEHALIEKFQDSKPQAKQDQLGLGGEKLTYRGQETDYDYYCKNSGICALEKFTSRLKENNAESAPVQKAPKKDKCSPLDPPNYEYPISDVDKAKFQAALKVALEQMENYTPPGSTPETKKEARKADYSVTGYADEELDSYMTINEMKAAPKITSLPVTPQTPPKELPGFDRNDGKQTPFEKDVQRHLGLSIPKNFTQANALWMDLLLFVASGLLIIFLLEQLYKVALLTGMKRTIQAMDSILSVRENNLSKLI